LARSNICLINQGVSPMTVPTSIRECQVDNTLALLCRDSVRDGWILWNFTIERLAVRCTPDERQSGWPRLIIKRSRPPCVLRQHFHFWRNGRSRNESAETFSLPLVEFALNDAGAMRSQVVALIGQIAGAGSDEVAGLEAQLRDYSPNE
jgi:hypothetical protein